MELLLNGNEREYQSSDNKLADGDYIAEIKNLELQEDVKGKYGTCDVLVVKYLVKLEHGKKYFEDKVFVSPLNNSKFARLFCSFYKTEILPNRINADELLGKRCWIAISTHISQSKNEFSQIDAWDFSIEENDGRIQDQDTIIPIGDDEINFEEGGDE